ncbi:MAG: hypothetical protein WA885_11430 [Phormidesmis sp.]
MNPLSRIRQLTAKASAVFRPVEEDNSFLKIWNHRFDYLYAEHPKPGDRPDWMTESRHPLADRLILQSSHLYGVRFGPETNYGLLDIDKGSPYHPRRDPHYLERIITALEPLGLVEHLVITSSASGGLHLYFPFEKALPSWKLAVGICALLEKAGFKIMAGWLEVFPNQKPFSIDGTISLYNGHRLPMQQGSYLLDQSLQPVASSERMFTRRWEAASRRNDICEQTLTHIIKLYRRRQYRITGKADKFLNDLNAEIEPGWSGAGQTNYLLGRIAMRSYIFGHVLHAPAPLIGRALIDDIVRIAINLPGYTDYCGHQHEIEARATDWAHAVEKSHYFPYGSGKPTAPKNEVSWNEQQRLAARDRIRDAVIALLKSDNWPEGVTARFDAIRTNSISGTTLYRNKDLWHPAHILAAIREAEGAVKQQQSVQSSKMAVENPPHPPISQREAEREETLPPIPPNLLEGVGCNLSGSKGSSVAEPSSNPIADGGVRNETVGHSAMEQNDASVIADAAQSHCPQQLVLDIQATLQRARIADALLKAQQAEKYRQQRQRQAQAVHRAQLEAWLNSGDPVLEAEAQRQLQRLEGQESRQGETDK